MRLHANLNKKTKVSLPSGSCASAFRLLKKHRMSFCGLSMTTWRQTLQCKGCARVTAFGRRFGYSVRMRTCVSTRTVPTCHARARRHVHVVSLLGVLAYAPVSE